VQHQALVDQHGGVAEAELVLREGRELRGSGTGGPRLLRLRWRRGDLRQHAIEQPSKGKGYHLKGDGLLLVGLEGRLLMFRAAFRRVKGARVRIMVMR
jgi:hypothetical protein